MKYEIIKHITVMSAPDFMKLEDDACFLCNDVNNALTSVIYSIDEKEIADRVFDKLEAEIEINEEISPCIYITISQYELWEYNSGLEPDLIESSYCNSKLMREAKKKLKQIL